MQLRDHKLFACSLGCAVIASAGCQQKVSSGFGQQSAVTFRGAGAAVLCGPAFSEHLPMDVIIAPRAIEPVLLPARPKVSLPADGRPVVVIIHAEIDRAGRVRNVTAAGESFPPPTAAEREFRAAAAAAVAQWQFEPAEVRRLAFQRSNDGGIYWIVKWRNRSPCRVELTFTIQPEGPPTWTLAALGEVPAGAQ